MKPTVATPWQFEHSFERELDGLFVPWEAADAPHPNLIAFNRDVATQLGASDDLAFWQSAEGLAVLVGNAVPEGAVPIAQGYAGHQFGGYSPRLGDGRALLVGEVIDVHGNRKDVHLKGSGRTPFARGGDGNAAIGPMLREFVIGEALHALGIPTTRALGVALTGKAVQRDTTLPGAVLTRVAASHLRVGSFQYAANLDDPTILRRLADYAIARHYPDAAAKDNPHLALLERVIQAQAQLVAQWMLVGFIHGVMNTDNVTISGESIDFGPCAFMDSYDPATVFSSIDHGGRYAYGNQPSITQWNLARFAETLLTLIDDDTDAAVEVATAALRAFAPQFQECWSLGMQSKLGIVPGQLTDEQLIDDYLVLLATQHVDYTNSFRALAAWLRGDQSAIGTWFSDGAAFDAWAARWTTQLGADRNAIADAMDAVNPLYIARNHLVEEALTAATGGDGTLFEQLCSVVANPFIARPGLERYTLPAPDAFGPYQTFCGT